jgi:UDP:flavonoid glycosyltransferase YjiC (YdhE family)
VISNGGSTTGYQALAQGRPVLGVAFNLDQYLATQAITRFGAGLPLRSGTVTAAEVTASLSRLLDEPSFAARAGAARDQLEGTSSAAAFGAFVDEACAAREAA